VCGCTCIGDRIDYNINDEVTMFKGDLELRNSAIIAFFEFIDNNQGMRLSKKKIQQFYDHDKIMPMLSVCDIKGKSGVRLNPDRRAGDQVQHRQEPVQVHFTSGNSGDVSWCEVADHPKTIPGYLTRVFRVIS
jgi:hypothetical protein